MIHHNTSLSKSAKKKSPAKQTKKPSSSSLPKSLSTRIVIVELHPLAYDELLRQFQSGFYGKDIYETAEIMLCEHLLWLRVQP